MDSLRKQIDKFASLKSIKPKKLGCHLNVHALDEDHFEQFAGDWPPADGRGQKRIVFNAIETDQGAYRFQLVGNILDHDYTQLPKYGEVKTSKLKQVKWAFVSDE